MFIVLFPSLDACIARATERARVGETPSDVADSHGFDWQAWSGHSRAHIIDTSDMTLAQVVAAIGQLVD